MNLIPLAQSQCRECGGWYDAEVCFSLVGRSACKVHLTHAAVRRPICRMCELTGRDKRKRAQGPPKS